MHIQAETYKRVNIIHFNKLISSFSRYTPILLSCNVVLKKTKIAYVGFLDKKLQDDIENGLGRGFL